MLRSVLVSVITISVALVSAQSAHATELGHAPKLISYGSAQGSGVEVRPGGGIKRLHETSASFRNYLRRQLQVLLTWEDQEDRADCANAPLVVVQRYRTDGWAYIYNFGDFPRHGAPEKCATGGNYAIWQSKHGRWQTVFGGQDLPRCGQLRRLQVPVDVRAQDCYRGNNTTTYTG